MSTIPDDVTAQRDLVAAIKIIDTLPSPSGEGGPRPAPFPAGAGRACAHRRSLTLQSFSDGAAPARRRVRGAAEKTIAALAANPNHGPPRCEGLLCKQVFEG